MGKHIGEEPSQQPPDWWKISRPCCTARAAISASAAGVASTRAGRAMNQKNPSAFGL